MTTTSVMSPTDGSLISEIAWSESADIDAAIARAHAVQPQWAAVSATDRGRHLLRIADRIESDLDEIAAVESRNTGKRIAVARRSITRAAACFRYYAGWPDKLYGSTIPVPGDYHTYTRREPHGVALGIVPWNSPFFFAAKKIAPAIAFGNAVICKPAPETPLTAMRLLQAVLDAGVPEGVVQIVIGGAEEGRQLVSDPRVNLIVFTGHHETGKDIARRAAENLTPAAFELGGKSPQLVFADADVTRATRYILESIVDATGQTCHAGSRVFVAEEIHDEVVERLRSSISALTVGDPLDERTDVGPQVTAAQKEKTLRYIGSATDQGAEMLAQAAVPSDPRLQNGYYVPPTLFGNVHRDMDVVRDEVFGPVLTITSFRDEEDAVRQANDTRYGLAAGIWTRDGARAHRLAARVNAGNIWVNTYRVLSDLVPYGGFGISGYGRENADEAARLYTRVKSVWVATSE